MRVVRIRIREQRRDRQKHLRYRQRRTPLVLQNVKANGAAAVHIAVIYLRRELDLRRLERVIRGEGHVQEEDAACVGGPLRAHDSGLPREHVILYERSLPSPW